MSMVQRYAYSHSLKTLGKPVQISEMLENCVVDTVALVVAAGRGTRAGAGMPKQYRDVGGAPLILHSLRALLAHDQIEAVQVVIHRDDRATYDTMVQRVDDPRLLEPVSGGATRALSVAAGLEGLAQLNPDKVLIHDAARPFLSIPVIDGVLQALQTERGAFPVLPVVDALWSDDLDPVDRTRLNRAQTPQGFQFEAIRAAHKSAPEDASDDVAVAKAAGIKVVMTQGSEANFKVTTQDDFARADAMLPKIADLRSGTGYDVHAFEPGDGVVLCGVKIPYDKALKGHSDADVAMHAVTDAIYGALAEGDIGQWFPPSEPKWKGAASDIFLTHAMDRMAKRGFTLSNMDVTIVCEFPKIGPHANNMREKMAEITGVSVDRISVKATTSEQLGFTGRGEGIAAIANVLMVSR